MSLLLGASTSSFSPAAFQLPVLPITDMAKEISVFVRTRLRMSAASPSSDVQNYFNIFLVSITYTFISGSCGVKFFISRIEERGGSPFVLQVDSRTQRPELVFQKPRLRKHTPPRPCTNDDDPGGVPHPLWLTVCFFCVDRT